ncbi:DMT family transporter [Nocardia beijingensis]|uniref:DMT family transporter n=1 Tax=Nocardia beijingensis TaxID=95162 RepID=UPI001894CB8A|nr:DMT family transporter [Nocardia beijingensis]MBF6075309.1 DMT family transporter [Nocardia beijingensis]
MRFGLVCGFGIGAGVAVQGRINGALGARLADGVAAAVISFGVGLVVLVVVFAVSGRLRDGARRVRRAVSEGVLRPWQLLGGLCGAFFVACQGLTVAAIGVTAFTVATVAGQLLSSLAVDRLGLGPSGRTPVTAVRLAGAALGVVAVLIAGFGHTRAGGGLSVPEALRGTPTVLLIALPALAGIGLAWQQAVNGKVGAVGGALSAALVNFGVGLAALLVIEALVIVSSGGPADFPAEPWLYLGGFIGVAFIALAALTVRWIGVLLLGLTSVAGQLLASLILDMITPTSAGLSVTAIIGCALTLVAVAVAARPQS